LVCLVYLVCLVCCVCLVYSVWTRSRIVGSSGPDCRGVWPPGDLSACDAQAGACPLPRSASA
jgi:hypothetical protein